MIDVFLSYTSEDRDQVEPLVKALEAAGLSVWWDRHIRSGQSYDREIEQAIEAARCILVVWSARSVESDWVRTEAMEGLDRGCLVPVRIDDVRPPLAFRRLQVLDLTGFASGRGQGQLAEALAAVQRITGETPDSKTPRDGERREITYVAVLISGLDSAAADPEDLALLREGLTARLTRTVELYGGVVNHASLQRFGVIFGLPVAHEDDPVRAVNLGLALTEAVLSYELPGGETLPALRVSVGIDSGLVVAKREEETSDLWQVAGSCVNVAEALLAAPGEPGVLLSATTLKSVAPYFTGSPAAEAGGAPPSFRVAGRSGVRTRIEAADARGFTPHQGRDEELALLRNAALRALSGRGRVAVIMGDAGIGKSRLEWELLNSLQDQELRRIEGTCQSYGTRSPYLPFLEVLDRLLDLDPDDREEAIARGVTALDPDLEPIVPLLLHLQSVTPTRFAPTQLEGLALRSALQEAVVALITVAARTRPTVLVLEDWHWADTASDEVLQRLIEVCAGCPIFVLVSTRPTVSPKWLTHSNVATTKLEPLSADDTALLLRASWQVDELPGDFVDLMVETTGGNPFFIEEISRALLEAGHVQVRDGAAVFEAQMSAIEFPSSVQAVIRSRLDQLSSDALELANLASVYGREFTRRGLEAVAPASVDLNEAVNELVDAELVVQTQLLPDAEFEFKHVMTQLVVYEALLRPVRRSLHDRIGEAIELATRDRPEEEVELLAYHFARGDNVEKAIEYTLRAGEKAASRSAIQEAASHFTRAAELVAQAEEAREHELQRLRALVNLGTALMVTKGYDAPEVIDAFRQAHALSNRVAGSREQFSTLWGLWRYYYNEAHLREARDAAEKLLDIAEHETDPEYQLAAHTAMGVVDLFRGSFEAAGEHLRAAAKHIGQGDGKSLAVRYGMSPEVMCLGFSALMSASRGFMETAREQVASACALATTVNHEATLAFAHYYGAAVAGLEGDPVALSEHATELGRIAEVAQFPHWMALAEFQLAMMEAVTGDAGTALPKILDARERAVSLGVGLLNPTYVVTAMPINLALGREEAAAEDLAGAEAQVARDDLNYFSALLLRARGQLAAARGSADAAELFDRAQARAAELGQQMFQLRALCDLLALPDEDGPRRREAVASLLEGLEDEQRRSPDGRRASQLLKSQPS